MTEQKPPRTVNIGVHGLVWLVLAAVSGPPLSAYAAVQVADNNSAKLVKRYQADRQAETEANRKFYCVLFGAQADAFDDAQTPTGRAANAAWLDLYKLAKCQPPRK